MNESLRVLFAGIARAIGLPELPADEAGAVQIIVGDDISIILFPESDASLTIVCPVAGLPAQLDYATGLWLLRRNHYDSPTAPFRVCCDEDGLLLLWGRVPTEGASGADIAGMIDALAVEVAGIRAEVATTEAGAPA